MPNEPNDYLDYLEREVARLTAQLDEAERHLAGKADLGEIARIREAIKKLPLIPRAVGAMQGSSGAIDKDEVLRILRREVT